MSPPGCDAWRDARQQRTASTFLTVATAVRGGTPTTTTTRQQAAHRPRIVPRPDPAPTDAAPPTLIHALPANAGAPRPRPRPAGCRPARPRPRRAGRRRRPGPPSPPRRLPAGHPFRALAPPVTSRLPPPPLPPRRYPPAAAARPAQPAASPPVASPPAVVTTQLAAGWAPGPCRRHLFSGCCRRPRPIGCLSDRRRHHPRPAGCHPTCPCRPARPCCPRPPPRPACFQWVHSTA